MKELTYEDWQKDPTPRVMWVWDDDKEKKIQRKVIHYFMADPFTYPVTALSKDERSIESFSYCAEIEKPRRMTNKELAR